MLRIIRTIIYDNAIKYFKCVYLTIQYMILRDFNHPWHHTFHSLTNSFHFLMENSRNNIYKDITTFSMFFL